MKKKHLCNITKAIFLVVLSFLLALETTNAKAVSILKTETSDSYYYEVKDTERDLEYSWRFLKEKDQNISVEDSLYIEEDLRLSLDADTMDTRTIHQMVNQEKLIISFDYHGALPLETSVRINVSDRFRDGENLYLYYYNPESDNIEYIAHNVKVQDGYVEFQIDHCSDYFLTAAVVNDAVNNPQSVNYIIIGLIVVVFILVAITLFQSKNK
ncbi:TPA: hypothetical protein IAB29_01935 [Candidatus Ventrenecus stercoripullorum]|nr:hypothetical protein [Candidatus Ventrenecus stercoripullorum]